MVVALTARHFGDLTELTETTKAVAAVAETLRVDFADEGQRYRHRNVLDGIFEAWFGRHTGEEITAALSASSVLWDRYQTFADVARSPRVRANPLFTELDQPRIGTHPAPGLPMSVDGAHSPARSAPALGEHTVEVLAARLGMGAAEIDTLVESGVVAT
jgi:2-methylfumaryl-CoA isomerase